MTGRRTTRRRAARGSPPAPQTPPPRRTTRAASRAITGSPSSALDTSASPSAPSSSSLTTGADVHAHAHPPIASTASLPPLPTLPSPTGSIGKFEDLPTVFPNVITGARQGVVGKQRSEPWGFAFRGNTCYRNAVTIMLLNSDRFMSYIQNWHAMQVATATADSSPLIDPNYTDMWMELLTLWYQYWTSNQRREITAAVNQYWQYQGTITNPYPWAVGVQQDASEYAAWVFQAFGSTVSNEVSLIHAKDQFDSMVALLETTRRRCNGCRTTKNVKIRGNHLDFHYTFPLDIDIYDTDASTGVTTQRTVLSLDDCLRHRSRGVLQGYYCDDCRKLFQAQDATKTDTEKMQAQSKRDQQPDYEWRSIGVLPEVLLTSFVRFRYHPARGVWVKNSTFVKLDEDLDLAPYFDHAIPPADSTKYKLVGVIAHIGDLQSGHYINYTKVDDQWWMVDGAKRARKINFNDINVTKMGTERRGDIPKPMQDYTPFIMCWEKVIPGTAITASATKVTSTASPPIKVEDASVPNDDNQTGKTPSIKLRFKRLRGVAAGRTASPPANVNPDPTTTASVSIPDQTDTKPIRRVNFTTPVTAGVKRTRRASNPTTPSAATATTQPARRAATHSPITDSAPPAKRTRLQARLNQVATTVTQASSSIPPTTAPAPAPANVAFKNKSSSPIPPPPSYPPPITPSPPSFPPSIPPTAPVHGNLPYTLHGTLHINGIPHPFAFPIPTTSFNGLSPAIASANSISLDLSLEDPNRAGIRFDLAQAVVQSWLAGSGAGGGVGDGDGNRGNNGGK